MKKILLSLAAAAVLWANQSGAAELKAGTEIKINQDTSFEYNFVERPKVGDVIMKITVSDQERRNVKVFAEYDMPSMRGHHSSGKVEFLRNRTQDYVLPIHFAMPGDWEIVLTFEEDGEQIYQGTVNLDI